MLTYSVVICTLDRVDELSRCIRSWLNQRPFPLQIVVVHGRQDGALGEWLQVLVAGTNVEAVYIPTAPSLVRQRNIGMRRADGDIVFFADDDAVYLDGYAQAILEVYEADENHTTGGVQGTIEGLNDSLASRLGISRLFLLTRMGDGTLQPSGWPAFYRGNDSRARVRVFSGVAMSYRRDVLQEFAFDEALARYWVGDDFEMAYRVSAKHDLFQVREARLVHHESPVGRDGARRQAKMSVVNHLYLNRKCFGRSAVSRLCWLWSELGMWVVAALWLASGRGPARLQGMVEGYRELWTGGSGSARFQVGHEDGKGGNR